MLNVRSAAVLALSILSFSLIAQSQTPNLTITGYQFVSQTPVTSTLWQLTYSASVLNNSSEALGSVTATISNGPFGFQTIGGQSTLNFGAVAANGQATSTNTFTVLVNRSISPAPQVTQLQWTFTSTPAPPIAYAGPPQTVPVESMVQLNGSGSTNPSQIGTLTFAWTITSKPNGSTARLSFSNISNPTFVADVQGNYTISLTVSNGTNTSAASTVTISTVNSPPVANAGPPQTVNLGDTVTLDGSGSTDVDGDTLTYSWVLTPPGGSLAVLSNPNVVKPTFVADVAGNYSATLTVNDGNGNTNSATVQITTLNSRPTANAGTNQNVNVGSMVMLSGANSTDPDGDALTYSWSFTILPGGSGATLTNPTSVNPTFVADVQGQYTVQLIVNDGHNNSNTTTVTITTNTILAPAANAGTNQTVAHGTQVTLNGSGTDYNNPPLPLTYSWSLICKPSNSTASLSSNAIADPTFLADVPSTNTGTCNDNFVAQLIVNNGYLSSPPSTVTISSTPSLPIANPGSAQSVSVGTQVTLSGSLSSDSNGDAISSYSWSVTSAPSTSVITTASLTGANTVSPSFTPDVAGQYVLQLIVKDSYATSIPVTVTITATSQPTITLGPSTMTIGSNDDSEILTVTLSSPAGSGGQVVNLLNRSSGVATVPNSITVQPNQTQVTFGVTPIAAGSAQITAYAGGWISGSATVNVITPTITITLDSAVGLTRSKQGTITLNLPAPAAGVTVSLSAAPTGIISFDTTSVSITSGNTTGTFNVTGQSTGTTTVSAIANGWIGATSNILVASSGQVTLPALVALGTGQSQAYNVGLATGAPVNGVTITLQSSDPTNVTFNPNTVFIAQGATAPTTAPQVTGVNFTSATITASAPGFTSGTGTVTVSDTLSFAQNSTIILTGAQQNLTLNLSSPAPAGGLSINLLSTNPAAASVPVTVTIAPNTTSVSVPVTAGTSGSATIQASDLPNLAVVSETVTTQVVGAIVLPSTLTVQAGQQTPLGITLTAAAPPGGLTVNLSSSDSTKVSINQSSVTIPANATAPIVQPQVTGIVAGAAIATISASGNGLTSASSSVTVTAGTASSLTATGSGQSAPAGQPFPTPIVVTVKDSSGNPVPNVTVTFTAPTTGPSATFSTGSYVTNASGQVTVNATANTVASSSSYTVTISTPSVSSYNISLTNNPGSAATITATSGGGQSATVNSQFSGNLLATVTDSFGNAVPGVSVSFAGPTTGASASFLPPNPLSTNSSGQVSVSATANGVAGTYNATATATGVATSAIFQLTNKGGNPASITAGTGSGQQQVIGTAFPQPLTVTVKDSSGNPVSGATVNFAGPSTGASIVPGVTATTSASGVASGSVTANNTASSTPYTVTATVSGFSGAGSATFSLTNTVASAAHIVVTSGSNGTPQSATVNTAFGNLLSVTVTDSGNNPISNQTVTFTAPSTGASATITGITTTNSSGIATATATANHVSGTYNVNATVGGVSTPATFALTNTPGTAATVVATSGGGQSANLGAAFPNPLVVTVTDQYGNNVADGTTVTFTGPSTGASITATTAQTSSGVASKTVTANSTIGGPYTVTASAGTGSATFSLYNTTTPASVSFVSGSPQSTTVGTPFGQPLKAIVKDVNSNPIPNVTVTFGSPSTGAALAGTNTAVTDSTGTATLTATANTVAGTYPVSLSVPGINTPSAFNLTNNAGTATSITVNGSSSQSTMVGTLFGTALSVNVTDQYGNAVQTGSVTFSGPTTGASIVSTSATISNGVASKQVTANTVAGGPYTVTATDGTGSASFALTNQAGVAAAVTYSSGTGQNTTINSAFAQPLVAKVTDSYGNLVSGANVTFTGPSSGPSISQNPVVASVAGIASTSVTANGSVGGPYTVTASVGTSSNATFSLTNLTPSPAAISCSAGCSGDQATINNAFPTNLAALVTDAGGNPISGVTVQFTAGTNPTTSASGNFIWGSTATAVTNSSGIATAPTLVANGFGTTVIGGTTFNSASFQVSASIPSAPAVGTATFSLVNDNTASTQIIVSSVTVGNGLQTLATVTFPTSCPNASCPISLSTSNASVATVSGTALGTGAATANATINGGGTQTIVYIQGTANSGLATITASSSGYVSGTATVLVTPSGFVITPPPPQPVGTPSITTAVGAANTTLTVEAAQLDPNTNAYLANQLNQSVAGGTTVVVPVSVAPAGVGIVSPTSVTFTGNVASQAVTFVPENTGTTTVTVGVPSGFTTPGQSQNQLGVNVLSAGINTPTSTSVGQWLETTQQVTFTSPLSGSLITITSNDPTKLLLSTSQFSAGSQTINVQIPFVGSSSSISFFVQGLVSTGSTTYTVSDPGDGFGSVNGTVTFTPSGFVIGPPDGPGSSSFIDAGTVLGNSDFDVWPVQLTAAGQIITTNGQIVTGMLAGGLTVTIPVQNTNTGAGSVSAVTMTGGQIIGPPTNDDDTFVPNAVSSNTTTTLTVQTPTSPAGFLTPTTDTSLVVNVFAPGMLLTDAGSVGQNLEVEGTITLETPAPASGVNVTLTSTSGTLLVSSDATGTTAGSQTATVFVSAGNTQATYWLQGVCLSTTAPCASSFANGTTASYTATASGFQSRTNTITFMPSGIVISNPSGGAAGTAFGQIETNVTLSSGSQIDLTVWVGELCLSSNFTSPCNGPNSFDSTDNPIQTLAPQAGALTVNLTTTGSVGGTPAASVTVQPGTSGAFANYQPTSQGSGGRVAISPTNPSFTSIGMAVAAGTTTSHPNYVSITVGP